MPAKKGTRPPNAGKGRRKGVPNRTTLSTREALTLFVERNANEAQALFDRVKKRNPATALALFGRIAEFVLPKLQRTELDATIKRAREYPAMVDMSPIDAVRAYQELMGGGGANITFAPSARPYVTPPTALKQELLAAPRAQGRPGFDSDPEPEETHATIDTNIATIREPQHAGEHRPIVDSKCAFCRRLWESQQGRGETRAVAVDGAPGQALAPDPAPDTGLSNAEDERLRHLHVHKPLPDAVCPGCRAAWVRL